MPDLMDWISQGDGYHKLDLKGDGGVGHEGGVLWCQDNWRMYVLYISLVT